ncbi:hypothetical protein WMF27_25600 [Sorangium sp. So ce281]|uniref:hypothetical protein n=1 Tax=unclassified Sorangium TaxID=2621164 RepID=UPI003F642CE7
MKRIPRTPRLQRVQCTRRTLQFKHHLGVELAGDKETVFLIGERERTMLRGRVVHLLGPLLDGRRTADELVAALDGEASAAEVRYALRRLEERGHVLETAPSPEAAGSWQAPGADAAQAPRLRAGAPLRRSGLP